MNSVKKKKFLLSRSKSGGRALLQVSQCHNFQQNNEEEKIVVVIELQSYLVKILAETCSGWGRDQINVGKFESKPK